jgi:hypothetical protein
MVMRLAFSIAVCVDPDILIVDEVLAVGDQAFQDKCIQRIQAFRRAGKTIVCVSHALMTVRELCARAIWLDSGRIRMDGPMSDVMEAYANDGVPPDAQGPAKAGEDPFHVEREEFSRQLHLVRQELADFQQIVGQHYCYVDHQNRTTLPGSQRPALIVPLDYEEVVPRNKVRGAFPAVEAALDRSFERMQRLCVELQPLADSITGIPDEATDEITPFWNNQFFTGMDARAAYGLTALYRPSKILEIGSGNSTRFFRRAIQDASRATKLVCIDPSPRLDVSKIADEIRRESVLDTPLKLFSTLRPGDFLFFDGSHLSFHGSDVTHFFLRVLPVVPAGVLVHVHDVCLPWDYPEHFDVRHYNEQYVLAALLLGGESWQPILPIHYLFQRGALKADGASFWMMRDEPPV